MDDYTRLLANKQLLRLDSARIELDDASSHALSRGDTNTGHELAAIATELEALHRRLRELLDTEERDEA